MDYHEFLLSLHLLAEERFGMPYRKHQREKNGAVRESMKQQVVKNGPRR